ncbi:MAG TPA: DUF4255 domain-containing protein [Thermoanaerobaculia bacterium]|nr:DUF4255 domain-containing protein [Thermoanaerobaculia bacterium]
MSTWKAVAAVTQTLKRRLEEVIQEHVPEAVVTAQRPEAEPLGAERKAARINLYLFQVANNPAFRNADLPTRNGDGSLLQRPQVALDLNYLLSFFGDESLTGQLLLGLTASTLHTDPYLGPAEIEAAVRSTPFGGSGLADQETTVRLAPLVLTLEELTKFWSGFFQVPYTLSLAYQASVVLLDAELTPQASLPVRGGTLRGGPALLPRLLALQPAAVEAPLAGTAAEVTLVGRQLGGPNAVAAFGDRLVALPAGRAMARVTVALPAGLAAGSVSVRVGSANLAGPGAPRPLLTSNALSLVLQPRIEGEVTFDPAARAVTVPLQPAVQGGQTVQLLLNEIHQGQPSYSYSRLYQGRPAAQLTFKVPDAQPGTYLVQVVVSGAASRLRPDFGQYLQPAVRIP